MRAYAVPIILGVLTTLAPIVTFIVEAVRLHGEWRT